MASKRISELQNSIFEAEQRIKLMRSQLPSIQSPPQRFNNLTSDNQPISLPSFKPKHPRTSISSVKIALSPPPPEHPVNDTNSSTYTPSPSISSQSSTPSQQCVSDISVDTVDFLQNNDQIQSLIRQNNVLLSRINSLEKANENLSSLVNLQLQVISSLSDPNINPKPNPDSNPKTYPISTVNLALLLRQSQFLTSSLVCQETSTHHFLENIQNNWNNLVQEFQCLDNDHRKVNLLLDQSVLESQTETNCLSSSLNLLNTGQQSIVSCPEDIDSEIPLIEKLNQIKHIDNDISNQIFAA
ncbi:hypothetical protein P9112_002040, partial [Eukaryota sp. TZLM1-RC]